MATEPDPKKPFTPTDLKSIQLAIGWLEEYKAGYVFIEQERRFGDVEENSALDRFFEFALLSMLDGLYPRDRNRGLLPVLRLVGCNTLANEIEAALDRKVGQSTFGTICRIMRNQLIAHVDFRTSSMGPFLGTQEHLQKQEDIDAFCESTYSVRRDTAAAFEWFKRSYPQLVEHATGPDDPVDN